MTPSTAVLVSEVSKNIGRLSEVSGWWVRGSSQTGALLVSQTVEHGAESVGGVGAEVVGALTQNLLAVGGVDVVVSDGDGVGGDLQESEAGEDLTARGEGEGGAGGHRLVCLVYS